MRLNESALKKLKRWDTNNNL